MSNFDQRFPDGWNVWPRDAADSAPQKTDPDSRQTRELDRLTGVLPPKTRSIPLKVLVPLLMDAEKNDSTWLKDFAEDAVVIDADLHDVLLAFQRIRRERKFPDAA